jgi:hypothetical protein
MDNLARVTGRRVSPQSVVRCCCRCVRPSAQRHRQARAVVVYRVRLAMLCQILERVG